MSRAQVTVNVYCKRVCIYLYSNIETSVVHTVYLLSLLSYCINRFFTVFYSLCPSCVTKLLLHVSMQPKLDSMKCPVCLNIQVDPCTLVCGHATCQLCLARLWEKGDYSCPVCKQSWKVIPSVSIDFRYLLFMLSQNQWYVCIVSCHFRDNIESYHSHQVTLLREQYTPKDRQLIQRFLSEKKHSGKRPDSCFIALRKLLPPGAHLLWIASYK